MRRVPLLVLTLLLLAAPACTSHAQVAAYVTFSPLHSSNVQTGSVYTGSGYQNQYASFWASGVGGGVTLTFLPLGLASLAFDLRGSTKPGTVGADTALFGVKLNIKPPVLRLKPYVQGSVGYLATRTVNRSTGVPAGATFSNEYLAYEILGGLDYPIAHFVDLRLIEVGGGRGLNIDSNANASIFTLNTGLVLHF